MPENSRKQHAMTLDLRGRVQNLPLPQTRPLLPLFEAVVNSIQSVAAANPSAGFVWIELERIEELHQEPSATAPIRAFRVIDNGEGFNTRNFDSFCRSDSRQKIKLGGKGVGRMLWLKAFDRVEVTSTYEESGEHRKRSFLFMLADENCVVDHEDSEVTDDAPMRTVVYMQGFKQPYFEKCPRKVELVAAKVLEHCVLLLLSPTAPKVKIRDMATGQIISLNDMLEAEYRERIEREDISVSGEPFTLIHMRFPIKHSKVHSLHYFAHQREVQHEPLSKFIPALHAPLRDGTGEFVWWTFVFGNYLDRHVDSERCTFSFPKDRDEEPELEGIGNVVTLSDIREKAVEMTKPRLESLLAPQRVKSRERVEQYIEQQGPEYRFVLHHAPGVVDSIPADASDAAIDSALHGARFRIEREAREEFIKLNEDVDDSAELISRETRVLATLTEIGKSDLVKYVVHRKVVLEALKRRLERRHDDAYSFESEVHRIICPMKLSTEEIPDDFQNLWVIDERLPFHRYLGSDRTLDGAQPLPVHQDVAPDLMAAFLPTGPMPFTDHQEELAAYASVMVVEFKRPLRAAYGRDDNPVLQMIDYIQRIRAGKARDGHGRPINVSPQTRYEAFLICDITEPIKDRLAGHDLAPTSDGSSYRGYIRTLNLNIEVIPYATLLSNARKRNRAFFAKLGIASP